MSKTYTQASVYLANTFIEENTKYYWGSFDDDGEYYIENPQYLKLEDIELIYQAKQLMEER